MRWLLLYTGMALFWASMPMAAFAADAQDCRLNRLATVKFDSLPDGRIKIPVMVENRPLSFMIDTGGVGTTIKWDEAKQLGLAVTEASRQLVGAGGNILNSHLAGENFTIGNLRVKNVPIYVEARPLPDVEGTLASDILRDYDVDIDFAHGNLSLVSQDHCAGQVVDWTASGFVAIPIDIDQGGHIRFPVKINGIAITAILDTGSIVSLINMKTAALLGIDSNAPELGLIRDGGDYQIYSYPFHSLEFGQISVGNPSIVIASDKFIPALENDLVIGIRTLRQMHLYIAYGERKLYLTGVQAN
jgi:predicted aspartyl protease